MKIVELKAYPISFKVPEGANVSLGIGRTVKRDAVIVKIITEDGITGWGEAHAARAPGAVAQLANTTLRQLVIGQDAGDIVGLWNRMYRMQLASHGMGAGAAIAMSGIDMALWDIKGKAAGWPLYRLLGGSAKPMAAYAGGISLGFQEPAKLVEEAQSYVALGYKALKLRIGDTVARDLERVRAVRKALGEGIDILTDANTNYTLADARNAYPGLDECRVGWLEEPFPSPDDRSYEIAAGYGRTPLAAGENHYTRFDFNRLIERKTINIFQPDLSKTGGITEGLRIAHMASAWKISIHPHTSVTGLNMAASLHFLAASDSPGYFEADLSKGNVFRDQLCSPAYRVASDGTVTPPEAPGLGIEVDEAVLAAHPVIDGAGYV